MLLASTRVFRISVKPQGTWQPSLYPELRVFARGASVAQLVSARPSELEVSSSILGDSNVCFDFLLICVDLALNIRKTEH